jgi:hypothetical protein
VKSALLRHSFHWYLAVIYNPAGILREKPAVEEGDTTPTSVDRVDDLIQDYPGHSSSVTGDRIWTHHRRRPWHRPDRPTSEWCLPPQLQVFPGESQLRRR